MTAVTIGIAAVPAGIAAVTIGIAPVSAGIAAVTIGIAPVSAGIAAVTIGIAPVSAGIAAVTIGIAPISAGIAAITIGIAPISAGIAAITIAINYNTTICNKQTRKTDAITTAKNQKSIVNIRYLLPPSFITKSRIYTPADIGLKLAALIYDSDGTGEQTH